MNKKFVQFIEGKYFIVLLIAMIFLSGAFVLWQFFTNDYQLTLIL